MKVRQLFKFPQGVLSALVAYPLAEKLEKRDVNRKRKELRAHYCLPFEQRKKIAEQRMVNIVEFAASNVPYYQDLFKSISYDINKLKSDIAYFNDIPLLTKDVIREQGERMLSKPLSEVRHHVCKTGGSTGLSAHIFYDQPAADYSAAVTLFAREAIGKRKYKFETHFACRFPDPADPTPSKWPSREDFKCFAMNRSNIFFDRVDDQGLEEMWQTLIKTSPYLAHAHPSTIYALACYIEKTKGSAKAFDVFESSGELLEPYMRETIAKVLNCRVVDRYGLAELGVMAYELNANKLDLNKFGSNGLQVLDSEGWAESKPLEHSLGDEELIFTGFRNKLMPLIRYCTGDMAKVEQRGDGLYLANVVGRIHDMVPINGIVHPTHYIQDMLDHRVGDIQEFQIDLRSEPPILKIVPEATANRDHIKSKIEGFWANGFEVRFVGHDEFTRVGRHAKFRHVVTK
jgi:phenylacetate-CoA ligase